MARYETPMTVAPEQMPARSRKWPLAGVMVIDLVIIFVAVLVATTIISILFIGARVLEQGVPVSPGPMNQDQALKLLGPDGTFVILLVQNAIFVLVPVLRVGLLRREPLAEIGFQAPNPARLILFGLGMGLVMYIGLLAIGSVFVYFGIQQNQADQLTKQFSVTAGNTFGQVLFLIGGGLIAPIGEETLFRGYIFNAIRLTFQSRSWGLPLAYVASSLIFAVIHFSGATQGVVALIVPLFFLALVLAWGMHRTGSLLPGIVAHALVNSVQLVALIYCINNTGVCPNL
jgi:membrane protease YdiL (CAAX protease family)